MDCNVDTMGCSGFLSMNLRSKDCILEMVGASTIGVGGDTGSGACVSRLLLHLSCSSNVLMVMDSNHMF